MRAPKSYLAILVGPLIGLGHWLLEELAREQAWWHSVPFAWLIEVWAAFTLGMIVQDVANPESWISGKLRAARRIFILEGVVPAHRTTPQQEWLEITARIRFVRAVKDLKLVIRIDANTNLTHAREQFVLRSESYDHVVADERRQFVVAIVPLKRYDGQPLGYQCWGDRFRESGDVQGMRNFSAGTRSTVEIQARGGVWFRQCDSFLFAATDAPGSGTVGALRLSALAGRRTAAQCRSRAG